MCDPTLQGVKMVSCPGIAISGRLGCMVLGPDGFALTPESWMRVCSAEPGAGAEPVPSLQERAFRSAPPWEILDLLGHFNQVLRNLRSLREDLVRKNEPPGRGEGPTLQAFPVKKTQQRELNLYQTLENPHTRDLFCTAQRHEEFKSKPKKSGATSSSAQGIT